jgi:hypothetical protein
MRGPEGDESWGRAEYREIIEPELIVLWSESLDRLAEYLAAA